jgi:hypothetical protein
MRGPLPRILGEDPLIYRLEGRRTRCGHPPTPQRVAPGCYAELLHQTVAPVYVRNLRRPSTTGSQDHLAGRASDAWTSRRVRQGPSLPPSLLTLLRPPSPSRRAHPNFTNFCPSIFIRAPGRLSRPIYLRSEGRARRVDADARRLGFYLAGRLASSGRSDSAVPRHPRPLDLRAANFSQQRVREC